MGILRVISYVRFLNLLLFSLLYESLCVKRVCMYVFCILCAFVLGCFSCLFCFNLIFINKLCAYEWMFFWAQNEKRNSKKKNKKIKIYIMEIGKVFRFVLFFLLWFSFNNVWVCCVCVCVCVSECMCGCVTMRWHYKKTNFLFISFLHFFSLYLSLFYLFVSFFEF